MTKKNLFLILAAIGLGAVYAIYFTDWFRPKTVKIFHVYRDLHPRAHREGVLPALQFGVNRKLRLTELKVVPLAVWQTNQNAIPVWHLVSDSNSVPVGEFSYGQFIGGMKPAVKGAHSQALETNVTYRLLITAGSVTGQHDFELK